MSAPGPSFPRAQTKLINDLLISFKSRSKSIKHSVQEWMVDLSHEDGAERLDIDIVNALDHRVRLSAWSTGEMWYRLSKPAPKRTGGWEHNFALHLRLTSSRTNSVVDVFKRAHLVTCIQENLVLWEAFMPRIDNSVSR